jgi:hypothetical protein
MVLKEKVTGKKGQNGHLSKNSPIPLIEISSQALLKMRLYTQKTDLRGILTNF